MIKYAVSFLCMLMMGCSNGEYSVSDTRKYAEVEMHIINTRWVRGSPIIDFTINDDIERYTAAGSRSCMDKELMVAGASYQIKLPIRSRGTKEYIDIPNDYCVIANISQRSEALHANQVPH